MKVWITPLSYLDDDARFDRYHGADFTPELMSLILSHGIHVVFRLVDARDIERGSLPGGALAGDFVISHVEDF